LYEQWACEKGIKMRFRFDENDDLVLEDIPDDLVEAVNRRALENGVDPEDKWREIIIKWSEEFDRSE
jgi:hypothetical protein